MLMVHRPHVRLQIARRAKRAPAMWALVVSAFLVDGAHMKSASTLAAERLPAMLARAIAARVRMRSWTWLFAGLAHGGGRAFKCQQRSPCLPQRVVMVGWGEIQMIAFAPKQRRRSSCILHVTVALVRPARPHTTSSPDRKDLSSCQPGRRNLASHTTRHRNTQPAQTHSAEVIAQTPRLHGVYGLTRLNS